MGDYNYAYFDNNFKMCVKYSKDSDNVSETIENNKETHIISFSGDENYDHYNIYKSNKYGNIILQSNKDGYYFNNNISNSDGNKKSITCSSEDYRTSKCVINQEIGYFINEISKNDLIYCDSNECIYEKQPSGYFRNSNNEFIKCQNSICNNIIIDKSSNSLDCTVHKNEVILDEKNNFYYCDFETIHKFKNSPLSKQYLEIKNVDASFLFPEIKEGNDNILIEIDNFSVTQYFSNSKRGICIYSYTEDVNCWNENSYKYYCPKKKSCTISKNCCEPKEAFPSGICNGYYFVTDKNNDDTLTGEMYQCNFKNSEVSCFVNNARGYYVITDENYIENNQINKYIKCDDNKCLSLKETKFIFDFISVFIHKDQKKKIKQEESCKDTEYLTKYNTTNTYECGINFLWDSKVQGFQDFINYFGFGEYINSKNNNIEYALNILMEFLSYEFTVIHRIIKLESPNDVIISSNIKKYELLTITPNSIIQSDISIFKSGNYYINDYLYTVNNYGSDDIDFSKNKKHFPLVLRNFSQMDNIYEMVSNFILSPNDISQIKIYYCSDGMCSTTNGYLKYFLKNSLLLTPHLIYCDNDTCYSEYNLNKCNSEYYPNGFYFNNGIQYCLNGEKKDNILFGDNKILVENNKNPSEYDYYITDDKRNVITLSRENGGILNYDNNVIICNYSYDENKCQIIKESSGYFFNLNNKNLNELIFCDSNKSTNRCSIIKEKNGFFFNSNTFDVIKCHKSICNIYDKEYYDEDEDDYSIIEDYIDVKNETLYYVHNEKDYKMGEDEILYLELKKIEANAIYPKMKMGKDIIIIKLDKYSITQFIPPALQCVNFDSNYEGHEYTYLSNNQFFNYDFMKINALEEYNFGKSNDTIEEEEIEIKYECITCKNISSSCYPMAISFNTIISSCILIILPISHFLVLFFVAKKKKKDNIKINKV